MSDQNMDRYLELFLEESTEQIDQLNAGLLRLEKEGASSEIIEDIFRSAHTLKSSAAFVGQNKMSELAHSMEDLLQQVRDNKLSIERELVDLLFRIVDRVRNSLSQIANGEDNIDDYSDLKTLIGNFHKGPSRNEVFADSIQDEIDSKSLPGNKSNTTSNSADSKPGPQPNDLHTDLKTGSGGLIEITNAMDLELESVYNGRNVYSCHVTVDPLVSMKNMKFLLLSENLSRSYEIFASVPDPLEFEGSNTYDEFSFIILGDCSKDELLKECKIDQVEDVKILEYMGHINQSGAAVQTSKNISEANDTRISSKTIKVASDKIDYLMNNVGELVIVNSGLQNVYDDLQQYFGDTGFLTELKGKIDQSERIVRELQSGIMKTRMIPVGVVFNRFARPVRDLAIKLNKKVELKFSGEDTELDKNIIDVLGEPLLHIMRNALDHGIETPEERLQLGKPETGTLHLQSYQSGNNVFIEVHDDGRGLNREKILNASISKGLIKADQELSDDEIYQMIFHPGFSTAANVSDVSGRGVGMGVVKKLMEEFKGSVQIDNKEGIGCSILMSFPLTLAIVSAVLIRLADEEYAFPLADVVETVHVSRDEITSLQGREIINLRGDILSIYHLGRLMGIEDEAMKDAREYPVVIVSSANRKVGFIVSGFNGKMEIVIKSLEQNFRSVNGLIGACLLGDGRIVMVVDVHGLLDVAHDKNAQIIQHSQIESLEAIKSYNSFVQAQKKQGRESAESVESVLRKKLSGLLTRSDQSLLSSQPQGDHHDRDFATNKPGPMGWKEPASTLTNGVASPTTLVIEPQDQKVSDVIHQSSTDSETEIKVQPEEGAIDSLQKIPIANESRDAFSEISPADFKKLQKLVNKGMENSGDVLSQLLGVQVRIGIPEFKTIQFEELKEQSKGLCYAIAIPIEGDLDGMNLLIFDKQSGLRAAGELMGLSYEEVSKMGAEDIESVLCELSNIVGSSILNEVSNSTDLSVMPSPPEFYKGEYRSIIEKIENAKKYQDELQILYIMTDFYRDDIEFFGRLFMIPTTKSMAKILNHI